MKYGIITILAFIRCLTVNAQYCSASFPSGVEPITSISFAGISNQTANTSSNDLENFVSISAYVWQGGSYTMTIKGNTGGNNTDYFTAFIDWDQDGAFSAFEAVNIGTITNSTGLDTVSVSGSITIPLIAQSGTTRLRIVKKRGAYPTACNAAGYGQAEDYTLILTMVIPCAGYPNAGTINGPSNVAPSTPFTVNLTGLTNNLGINFQWQADNGSGWQAIPGATDTFYSSTLGITSTVSYRAEVTCTNGNFISYSAAHMVSVTLPPTLLSPNQSQVYNCGTSLLVNWITPTPSTYQIDLVATNPPYSTIYSIANTALATSSTGSYTWNIPSTLPSSIPPGFYRIIVSNSSLSYSVMSDSFSLVCCSATSYQGLHLDTLLQNPNEDGFELFKSATFHQYYWVHDISNQPMSAVPVRFRIYRLIPPNIYLDSIDVQSTSNSAGILDVLVPLGGNNASSFSDDLLQTLGTYKMVPIGFGTGACNIPISNPPAYVVTDFILSDYTSSLDDSYGIFLKGKAGLSGCVTCAIAGDYGFRGLEGSIAVGGGVNLTIHSTNLNQAKWDLSTATDVKLSTTVGIRLPIIQVNLLDGSIKYGEKVKIKDWAIGQSSVTDQLFAAWLLLRPALQQTNTNKLLDLLVKGIGHYLESQTYSNVPFDYEITKSGEANLALGPTLSALVDFNGDDPDNLQKWKVSVFNISGHAEFSAGTGYFANNTQRLSRTASLMTDFDYTPLSVNFGNHLQSSFTVGTSNSARLRAIKDNGSWTTGSIEFSKAGEQGISVGGLSVSTEKEVSTSLFLNKMILDTIKYGLNSGALSNYIGNYLTGSNLPGLKLLLKASPLGNGNSLQQECINLCNYIVSHHNPNWQSIQFGWQAEKTYTVAQDIDLSMPTIGAALGVGGSLKLSTSFGQKNTFVYPLERRVYSSDVGGMLPVVLYGDNDSFIDPPSSSLVDILWNGLSSAISSAAQNISTAMFAQGTGFMNRINQTLFGGSAMFVNTSRNANTALKGALAKTTLGSFTDFSLIEVDIPSGNTAFNSGTDFQYAYYFPGGDLKGVVSNTLDTVVIISDIFYIEAKENGNSILQAPNGNFTVTATLGTDDLKYLGLDTNANVSLLYSAYNDTLWQNLGAVNLSMPLTINTNNLGNYAIGKILPSDTIPPVILISLPTNPTASDFADVEITDNSSGIDWKSVVPALNGMPIKFDHNTFDGHIQVPLSYIDSLSTGTFVFSVQAQDLVGNFAYNVGSVTLAVNQPALSNRYLLNVYPNPAKNIVNIIVNMTGLKHPQINMTTLEGHLIKKTILGYTKGQNLCRTQLDVSDLAPGIYLLSVIEGNIKLETRKIVIE
jgi:hypothetical protein